MSNRFRYKHHLVLRLQEINMRSILVVTLALQAVLCCGQLRFDGDEVLRIFAKTPEEAAVLKNFTDKLDFWTRISKTRPTDVRVSSAEKINLREKLDSLGIKYEVFIDDVEKYVRIEARSQVRSAPPGGMDWTSYHSLGEIHNFMTEIAEQNNDIATIFDIGKSTEGRTLKLIRIGYPSQGKKAGYFIDGGIHAREWATPAVTTYFINELLTKRSEHDALLKSMDFYIIPSLNPDGYEYSRSRNRMWRKTRSNHLNSRCAGVDPNRNYDEHFGGDGTSGDTCSEIFRGPHAFSEPETAAVKNFITSQANDVDWLAYTAMHSYSQVILTPWGWGDEFPRNYKELKRVGDKAAAAIKAVHGKIYEVGSVTELMYAAAGGSDDWAHRFHFPYAYTIEVRDTGRYGFLLPANQILPCARENFQAIKVIAEEALKSRH